MKSYNNAFKATISKFSFPPKFNSIQFNSILTFILILCTNIIIYCQPTVKSSFSFPSTTHNEVSEDWPTHIFPSADCIHTYFAGFSNYSKIGTCPDNRIQGAVVGKINKNTQKLIWENEYNYVYDQNGLVRNINSNSNSFTTIMEMGNYLWAYGGVIKCSAGEISGSFVLKADPVSGIPEPGYPKLLDSPDPSLTSTNFPILENGVVTGTAGCGYNESNGTDYVLFLRDENGNLNTSFGTNGYVHLGGEIYPKRMIKIEGDPDVKYIYIGYNYPNKDIAIGALDASGNILWDHEFNEGDVTQYVDNMANDIDKSICSTQSYENDDAEGWELIQDGDYVYLACKFDIHAGCNALPQEPEYVYTDIGILKAKVKDGTIVSGVNVGVSEAVDFYPDIIIKEGKIYVLGTQSHISNNQLYTDGKISIYNTNLELVNEKIFKANASDVVCPFEMAFDCNDQLEISGNNKENDEDYNFYLFSNQCQTSEFLSPTNDITTNLDISTPITWTANKKVSATIRIKQGGTLTISSGVTIEFGSSWELVDYSTLKNNNTFTTAPRIIVESGGTLTLNACTLRGFSSCPKNGMWDGIELENGGIVNLNDNVLIEDAKYGILVGQAKYNEFGQLEPTETNGGGIITTNSVDNSNNQPTFKNCWRDLHFAPSLTTTDLKNCHFLCDNGLKDPQYLICYSPYQTIPPSACQNYQLGTQEFVHLNSVRNLKFTTCEWKNFIYNVPTVLNNPPEFRGIGINSFGSKYEVLDHCKFSELNIGIQASAPIDLKFNVRVDNQNEFKKNVIGIKLIGGRGNRILNNNVFELDPYFAPGYNYLVPQSIFGVYNAGATQTNLVDNSFSSGLNMPSGTKKYGYVSENTHSDSYHKHNNFTKLFVGEQSQQDNTGLQMYCNDHLLYNNAWKTYGKMSAQQGNCPGNLNLPALTPDDNFALPCVTLQKNHIESNVAYTYNINPNQNPMLHHPPTCVSTSITLNYCLNSDIQSACDFIIPNVNGNNVGSYISDVNNMGDGPQRQAIINEIIRYYVDAGAYSSADALLAAQSGDDYIISRAMLQLDLGNYTLATTIANSLSISSDERADFIIYFNVLKTAKQENIGLNELSLSQIQILENIALHRTLASYASQAILIAYYNHSYLLPLETEDGLEYRSYKNMENKTVFSISNVQILPSPVLDNCIINYEILSDAKNPELIITSIEGKLEFQTKIKAGIQSLQVNLSKLPVGIYSLFIKDDYNVLSTSRFVKN